MSQYQGVLRRVQASRKSGFNAPAYSRFVNRPLGSYLASAAFMARLTANQLTLVSAVCSFAAIGMIAALQPSPSLAAAISALLLLGYALDSADGQLARLNGGGTLLGEWMDHVLDSVKVTAIHLAVLISFYRFERDANQLVLLLPVAFTLVSVVYFFTFILTDQLRRRHGARRDTVDSGSAVSRSVLLLPTDFGVLCFSFLLWSSYGLFVKAYGILLCVSTCFLTLALVRWWRAVSSLSTRSVQSWPEG